VTNAANDANCGDFLACNGDEVCDAINDCQPGTAPALSNLFDNGSYVDVTLANAFSPAASLENGNWVDDGIMDFFVVAGANDLHCAFEWHMTGTLANVETGGDFDTARLRIYDDTTSAFSVAMPVADVVVSEAAGTLSRADTGDVWFGANSVVTFTANLADLQLPVDVYSIHVSFPNNAGAPGFWHNALPPAPSTVCSYYWGTSTVGGGATFEFETATDICTIRGASADNLDFRFFGL
jgi:hypothetical protein